MASQPTEKYWHTKTIDAVLSSLDVDAKTGLTEQEASARLDQYGLNKIESSDAKSWIIILRDQFLDVMVIILIVAAVISFAIGEELDAIVIMAIVILNAVLGFVQEYRAEQAMEALRDLSQPEVKVRRGGSIQSVASNHIVPGDVVLLEAGNLVPADLRIIEQANLRIQEAALTGESEAVQKRTPVIDEQETPLGDRRNLAYKGTTVAYGRGEGLVVETGMRTELGNIAELIQGVADEQTPLQQRMAQIGGTLAVVAVILVAIVFGLGILRGSQDFSELFLTAIALAVAAVPEGLPAVVTISLALGAQRMLKRNALIRKLPAVETLGSVTTICSDKTGTLTENQMTVVVIDVAGHQTKIDNEAPVFMDAESASEFEDSSEELVLVGGALCNDARIQEDRDTAKDFSIIGDPTEGALLVAASRYGMRKADMENALPRVGEVPFTSDRKRMSTIHEIKSGAELYLPEALSQQVGKYILFCKGAVDVLLDLSNQTYKDGDIEVLSDESRQDISQKNEEMAKSGLRVLGVAYRLIDSLPDEVDETVEAELIIAGMSGMIDPPRSEVAEAVRVARQAGVRAIMITGDHPLTAHQIAEELGIADADTQVITGIDLDKLSEKELQQLVKEVSVFARVSPENKIQIVTALQRDETEVVAMTGDGVNDAPALRKADIGVAMGITGTDVSKEAADMVLVDDNFATIVSAVEEGRNIFDNVRKFIKYTLTSNLGEIFLMLFAPFLGMPLPLTAIQILWINLVTDGLPGLALGVEKAERGLMTHPPYGIKESIFSRALGRQIVMYGLLMGMVALGAAFVAFQAGNEHWRTIGFTVITLSQMGNALAIRSHDDSIFKIGFLSNKVMIWAVSLTFVLQLLVIYVPFLQNLFETSPLTLAELVICLLLSSVVFWAIELEKLIFRMNQFETRNLKSSPAAGD